MSKRLLVVDDSPLNVRLLTDILEDEGYEVFSVNNGSDVLDATLINKPEVILLDIMMPGLDGFEVCHLLKTTYETKNIPIIMVTAKSESADIKRALELGAHDYVKKPFDESEVLARIQSALRLKEYQDILRDMAMKDSLTGLYNHALLIDLFEKEFAKTKRDGDGLTFVMLDIDHFKKVNDTYGHSAGDVVLKDVSKILLESIRSCDIVGRYGGEEFSIVLLTSHSSEVIEICERIRKNIENYSFNIGDSSISITISLGAYISDFNSQITPKEMIKLADESLYTAKRNGRNRLEVYTQ
ncbi:MAG: diguanylate cyclase [Bacillales bacterium]|jgi:diguanylate cyclase (GGDEF)-like protein|nr:diguanylate cyclase [Bacillales bacterium]